jgi:hypothetical protein
MARVTINRVNERIAAYGYEIVKGKGYFYFAPLNFPENPMLDDSSVLVYHLNSLDLDRWESELVQKIADTK